MFPLSTFLLIFVLLVGDACAAGFRVPPRVPVPQYVPPIPRPVPRPAPVPAPNSQPKVNPQPYPQPAPAPKPIPVPAPRATPYTGGYRGQPNIPPPRNPANLGGYVQRRGQQPFAARDRETNEAWKELADRVGDILDVIDKVKAATAPAPTSITYTYTWTSYVDPAEDPYSEDPGEIVTDQAVFDPTLPIEACNAMFSLAVYCNGADAGCACYSAGYYVPEQANLLAQQCANYQCLGDGSDNVYCNLEQIALTFTSYCYTNVLNAPSTLFGAVEDDIVDSTTFSDFTSSDDLYSSDSYTYTTSDEYTTTSDDFASTTSDDFSSTTTSRSTTGSSSSSSRSSIDVLVAASLALFVWILTIEL